MSEFSCLFCRAPIAIQAFIAGVSGFDRGTRSGFSTCRNCNRSIEFQVRNGNLTIGYSYSSGSLHFEGLFDVPASGLKCVVEEQGVHYIYKGIRYEVPGGKANR